MEPAQLDRAVAKLDRLSGARPDWLARPELRSVLEQLAASLRAHERRYLDRVASRTGERVPLIETSRITHFFAQDKLTFAVASGRNYAVDHSIAELEQKLDPGRFIRIHRSTLLNIEWCRKLTPGSPDAPW